MRTAITSLCLLVPWAQCLAALATAPDRLLVDHRAARPSHLADRPRPHLSWAVPHLLSSECRNGLPPPPLLSPPPPRRACMGGQQQHAFQVELAALSNRSAPLLSPIVQSQASNAVVWPFTAPLAADSVYTWRVRVWTTDCSSGSGSGGDVGVEVCGSAWSQPMTLITSLFSKGFSKDTKPIWHPTGTRAQFVFLRAELQLPSLAPSSSPLLHARVKVAALPNSTKLLGAYRLYIAGKAAGTGPGRGEAVEPSAAIANHTMYDVIDVTKLVATALAEAGEMEGAGLPVALQSYGSGRVALELELIFFDGSTQRLCSNNHTFLAYDATNLFGPTNNTGGAFSEQPREFIDANLAPTGDGCQTCWRVSGAELSSGWVQASTAPAFPASLSAKRTLPLVVTEGVAPTVVQVGEGHWFFDFGTELMAGIVLKWHAPALAGATLDLRMGEELASPQRVMEPMRTTNIYQMTWTLANGAKSSSFEQHEYFLFRYGELRYSAAGGNHDEHKPSPGNDSLPFELTAWQVHYPWSEDDSFFTSSDAGLDNIWNLCRNTLRVTSLDTTTDSNTRERRPYEADGFITGSAWAAMQGDVQWARHSTKFTLLNPTWPTEWRQTLPLLAHADYMLTGDIESNLAFSPAMYALLRTASQIDCVDPSSNLVNFTTCARQAGTRDITDWPVTSQDDFQFSNVSTIINAYAVGAIQALAVLADAVGNASEAVLLRRQAEATKEAMLRLLVFAPCNLTNSTNLTKGAYLDGYNIMHQSWHSQVFSNFFQIPTTPSSARPPAPPFLPILSRGMVGSVYAAFAFTLGLYGPLMDTDHGHMAHSILTSCATNSWCNMLKQGATATMEAWTTEEKPNLTWSHPWATAPVAAIAQGLMGITLLQPAYSSFQVKPQPGPLPWASIRVPSLHGPIEVSFNSTQTSFNVTIAVPGNTFARVCLPSLGMIDPTVELDGKSVQAVPERDYFCVAGVGSSAAGNRVLTRTVQQARTLLVQ